MSINNNTKEKQEFSATLLKDKLTTSTSKSKAHKNHILEKDNLHTKITQKTYSK